MVPKQNGIKGPVFISLKRIIALPILEPIWTIPCIGSKAIGGSLRASNPNKIAPPPIPKAALTNEVIMLAIIKK